MRKRLNCNVTPYEGSEPYIFFSYAHKDAEIVYPILEHMVHDGYRVWFDDGNHPGDDWLQNIAIHLKNSNVCLAMISQNSDNSHNCKSEMTYAIKLKKRLAGVVLESFVMTDAMEMLLSSIHYVRLSAFPSVDALAKKLYGVEEIQKCFDASLKKTAVCEPQPRTCCVRFVDDCGRELAQGTYPYGASLVLPEPPVRDSDYACSYTFSGWSPEPASTVTEDAEYTACFESHFIPYTVRFVDENGAEIAIKVYQFGDALKLPPTPTRPSSKTEAYTFSGWEPKPSASVTENMVYTATFAAKPLRFTVKFVNQDGHLLEEKEYLYGETLSFPLPPAKRSDSKYSYTFSGWSPEPAAVVTENRTYTACFQKSPLLYSILFRQPDGTEIFRAQCKYGDKTPLPAAKLVASKGQRFQRWKPQPQKTVTGNAVYTAVYDKVGDARVCTIRFLDHKRHVITEKSYREGETLTPPEVPVEVIIDDEYCQFKGWEPKLPKLVTKNQDFQAIYSGGTVQAYLIQFLDHNGSVISKKSYCEGDALTPPEVPEELEIDGVCYQFSGWDPELPTVVTKRQSFQAIYDSATVDAHRVKSLLLSLSTGEVYRFEKSSIQIGRSHEQNDIVLAAHQSVSKVHAIISFEKNSCYIKDMASMYGTFVNGEKIKAHEPVPLKNFSTFRLADNLLFLLIYGSPVETYRPGKKLAYLRQPGSDEIHLIDTPTLELRRQPKSPIPALRKDLKVSRAKHAQITQNEFSFQLEDLDSKNGTILNEHTLKAHTPEPLSDGDLIGLGDCILEFHIVSL